MKYKASGVDIDKANEIVKYIKKLSPWVGDFGGIYSVGDKILVSSVDGVGTKLKIAKEMGIYSTVGEDLVNHCVNDILCMKAEPLYFMDYIGVEKLEGRREEELVEGIVRGCEENGIPLIGGEIAELPGIYREGEYDLVGFITGVKKFKEKKENIKIGDKVVGLLSNGVHTNGYSLIRRILWEKNIPLSQYFPEFQKTLGEELLRVHKSYKKEILPLLPQIKTLAHITGGGFYDNIRRKLPKGKGVKIVKHSWQIPPVFKFIAKEGKVEEEEMFKVFNMGIGMVMIVEELSILTKLPLAVVIGEVIEKEGVYFV